MPIHLSTTFERSADGEYPLGFSYSREKNPTRQALEVCLADLEGGTEALAFSSGLAVAAAVLQGLEPGDHIIAADDVYWALRTVIGEVFGKAGLDTSYVDFTKPEEVRAAMRPNTRLIWIETPSNPMMKVCDLAMHAALAREAAPNAITVCDGTFATPMLQRPLELRHRYGGALDHQVHQRAQRRGGRRADHAPSELPVRARATARSGMAARCLRRSTAG